MERDYRVKHVGDRLYKLIAKAVRQAKKRNLKRTQAALVIVLDSLVWELSHDPVHRKESHDTSRRQGR